MTADAVLVILAGVFEAYKAQVLTLLGLIVANLITGIAVSVKAGKFDIAKIADFYRVRVLPGLLGWLGVTAALYLVNQDLLGEFSATLNATVANGLWLTVIGSVGASVYENVKALQA